MRLLPLLLCLFCAPASAESWPLPHSGQQDSRWSLPRREAPGVPPGRFTTTEDQPQSEGISAGEAARRAQQINGGGRVLSAEPAQGGWRVKLIKNGDVRIVFVPD